MTSSNSPFSSLFFFFFFFFIILNKLMAAQSESPIFHNDIHANRSLFSNDSEVAILTR